MKRVFVILATLTAFAALATERVHPLPHPPSPAATSASTSSSGSPVANGGAASSGSVYGASGDTSLYVLPAPIAGSNLPAGMCQRSKYSHRAFVWNFVSLADGDSHTDMECLRLLVELEALRARPLPKQTVEILTLPPAQPAAAPAACEPPARAKSVVAAKKAGACK